MSDFERHVEVVALHPVQLTMKDIGPFRDETPKIIRFLGPHPASTNDGEYDVSGSEGLLPGRRDLDRSPANMFLLVADNGEGKTSVLETIHGLFDLLSVRPAGMFWRGIEDGARAQLDLRTGVIVEGVYREVLLSVWFGSDEPLVDWCPVLEKRSVWEARTWAGVGFVPSDTACTRATNELGRLLLAAIRNWEGKWTRPSPFGRATAEGTTAEAPLPYLSLPSVLYFPTDRSVGRRRPTFPESSMPAYAVASKFDADERRDVIDVEPMLNALAREDTHRLDRVLDLLNAALLLHPDHPKNVIWDPIKRKCQIAARNGSSHDLSQLSDGERSQLAFHARVILHMTRASIVLVDEVDIHIHPRWTSSMLDTLKLVIRRTPGSTLIFTTHNRELVRAFEHRTQEEGITKGGAIARRGLFG